MIEKIGGRKFVLSVIITISLLVLAVVGKITYEQLMSGWLWALGIFVAANTSQKFAGK